MAERIKMTDIKKKWRFYVKEPLGPVRHRWTVVATDVEVRVLHSAVRSFHPDAFVSYMLLR